MARRLQDLVQAARSLPGVKAAVRPLVVECPEGVGGEVGPLRRRTAALLAGLAERLRPALLEALARAGRAWDQVDALSVLGQVRPEVDALAADWRAAGGPAALEGLLVLEAATALVALIERRLATLVRLRGDGDLIVDGRPFLDVPGALAEAAAWWAA